MTEVSQPAAARRFLPILWRVGTLAGCFALVWCFVTGPNSPVAASVSSAALAPAADSGATPATAHATLLAGMPAPTVAGIAPEAFPSPGPARRASDIEAHTDGGAPAEGLPHLARRLGELVARAEGGDRTAALTLGSALMVCGSLWGELDRMQASLHPHALGQTGAAFLERSERIEARLHTPFVRARLAHCEGVPRDAADSAGNWLERAARGGDALASQLYIDFWLGRLAQLATDPPRLIRFRANASAFMHRDAARCIPNAFLRLQQAYQLGSFETPDPMLALAYGSVFRWLLDGTSAPVAELAPSANPSQILQAHSLANRLFERYCR